MEPQISLQCLQIMATLRLLNKINPFHNNEPYRNNLIHLVISYMCLNFESALILFNLITLSISSEKYCNT
jgi:hypothetical protein